ncbi:MAG: PAS domain S-box protein, partial [Candidatus Hydrogenedentes bacterium]|nr:PAS domain S-box protein [Candidatus Hydrogenedentota bacterium]
MSDPVRQESTPQQASGKRWFGRIPNFVRFEGGLPLYLIPILLGVAGILFSREIPEPFLRTAIVMFSVMVPLLAGGNWLARIHSRGHQRIVLIIGVILLTIGAMVSVSELSTQVSRPAPASHIPGSIGQLSRWLGMLGLLGGLFVILYSIVRREEQASEVAEQFRRLAEQIGEGVLIATPDGTITLVNQCLLDMSGLSEEQIIGQNALTWAEQLPLEPIVRSQRESKSAPTVEYQLKWVVGGKERYLWLQGTRIRTRRGTYAGMMATVRDITEHRELSQRLEKDATQLQLEVAERTEQLEQSQERLRKLLLNMNEGFVTIDTS